MFFGGIAQGISEGIDSNRAYQSQQLQDQQRAQLIQMQKLKMEQEQEDLTRARNTRQYSADLWAGGQQNAPPPPGPSQQAPMPGQSSQPMGPPSGGMPPPSNGPVNLQAGQRPQAPQVPAYQTADQGAPVVVPSVQPQGGLPQEGMTFKGLVAQLKASGIPTDAWDDILTQRMPYMKFESDAQKLEVTQKLAERKEERAVQHEQYLEQHGDQQFNMQMGRMAQQDRQFNQRMDLAERKANPTPAGGRNYLAEYAANGKIDLTQRMSKDATKNFNEAAQYADENGIEFDPQKAMKDAAQARSFGRTAGGSKMLLRAENIESGQELLGEMKVTIGKLNYPKEKFAGAIEQWKQGQLNDPVFTEYMNQRADALFVLSNALKQNGVTDKSLEIEAEVAAKTMDPEAFGAYFNTQMRALNRAGKLMNRDLGYKIPEGKTVAPGTGGKSSESKVVKSKADYDALQPGDQYIDTDNKVYTKK